MSDYGSPDRFLIHVFDLQLHSGEWVKIRQESWYSDQMSYEIIFKNGENFTDQITGPVTSPGLRSTAYQTELFFRGMSLTEVLSATGERGFYAESMPRALFEDGTIFFSKG